jgi:intracellular sulfur oxidation DsrE/DsrF family protein
MKNLIAVLFILIPAVTFGQKKPVHIVFDVTSKDPETHAAVLRHVKGMSEAYPDAMFEVVIYGGALPLVVNDESPTSSTVQKLSGRGNVSFKVCAMAMEKHGIKKEQLVDGVQVVPDGILEIAMKQADGWGYIKESHN